MQTNTPKAIFWHRRDLRIEDNAGLYKALTQSEQVIPVFIFDRTILDVLPANDQRVLFIHQAITRLKEAYQKNGSDLIVRYGDPKEWIPKLANELRVSNVFTNRDYEPQAIARDKFVHQQLQQQGVELIGAKDQVIFEKSEITKDNGEPYTVFTPYSKKWMQTLNDFYLRSYPTKKYLNRLHPFSETEALITLEEMQFEKTLLFPAPPMEIPEARIQDYQETRDFPAIAGTSRLGVHLRFGTISIRKLTQTALRLNTKFLSELIWRDFYQMILYYFPESPHKAIKPAYDRIPWNYDEKLFHAWCQGKTGYPLVDAGMRELNATGYMHNRVRMVVASFLTKHLLHDWRLGERYFAEKLLDFDLASNVGGWQWAAGCGCDAAPYFRIFNPQSQQEKFDPDQKYIRQWVPELGTDSYPDPIVDHRQAREKILRTYKQALNET